MVERAILGYYEFAVLYVFLTLYVKRKSADGVFTLTVVFLLPFLGIPLSLLQICLPGKGGDRMRFKELVEGRGEKEQRVFRKVDIAKEVNLVPLAEALAVNDLTTRRRLLLDVLKDDLNEYMIPLLERAVSNEDTETSHYAVSAVMEIKRKLQQLIQKWSIRYAEEPGDLDIVLQYANVVKQYIMSGFMDPRMQKSCRMTYAKLLDELLLSPMGSCAIFSEKIKVEMDLGRFDAALQYCQLFRTNYPDCEEAYVTALHLYYVLKMKEAFYNVLEELKTADFKVSNSTLTIIRYWSSKGA